jgi:hypothetical protein
VSRNADTDGRASAGQSGAWEFARTGSSCQPTSGENRGVQFSPDLRDRVADGTITVSYRLWSRPKVKVGGTYRSTGVEIEIDDIDVVPFSSVTDEDLAQTGEPDLESLRRRTAHAGPVHDDTLVYRVEFHVVSRRDEVAPARHQRGR